MNEKTIGGFIAALRKASGMTQQTLAERLNVSNKAVSRWERDECAPDIMLIPAIAELFGVTCDELLKGERIAAQPEGEAPKPQPKSEKRLRAISHAALSRFRIIQLIALSLSITGLVMLFSISYGFYKPVVASGLLCLFVIASAVVNCASVMSLNARFSEDNELFDASESLKGKVRGAMLRFCCFNVDMGLLALSAMLPMLYLVLGANGLPIDCVITIDSYFEMLPFVLFLGVDLSFAANMLVRRVLRLERSVPELPDSLKRPQIAQTAFFAVSLLAMLNVIFFSSVTILDVGAGVWIVSTVASFATLAVSVGYVRKSDYGAKSEYVICRIRSFLMTFMLIAFKPITYGYSEHENGSVEATYMEYAPAYALAGFTAIFVLAEVALYIARKRTDVTGLSAQAQ